MCTLLRSSPTTAASSLACVPGLEICKTYRFLVGNKGIHGDSKTILFPYSPRYPLRRDYLPVCPTKNQ